jgi:hypothetical protein
MATGHATLRAWQGTHVASVGSGSGRTARSPIWSGRRSTSPTSTTRTRTSDWNVLIEWLAGRCGPERQQATWNQLRQEAHELTGVNYGQPSTGSQTAVIGTLYGIVCSRAYYAENPDKVFAGLSAVK